MANNSVRAKDGGSHVVLWGMVRAKDGGSHEVLSVDGCIACMLICMHVYIPTHIHIYSYMHAA